METNDRKEKWKTKVNRQAVECFLNGSWTDDQIARTVKTNSQRPKKRGRTEEEGRTRAGVKTRKPLVSYRVSCDRAKKGHSFYTISSVRTTYSDYFFIELFFSARVIIQNTFISPPPTDVPRRAAGRRESASGPKCTRKRAISWRVTNDRPT